MARLAAHLIEYTLTLTLTLTPSPNPTHNLQPYLHQESTDDELQEIVRRTGPPPPFWQQPEARTGCLASNDAAAVVAQKARAKEAEEAVLYNPNPNPNPNPEPHMQP